jgi:hypothetical protein
VSVDAWFAQPDHPLGTAILLPGRMGGVATPLLHWSASLLTQLGWSVLGVTWDEEQLSREGAVAHVRRCVENAFDQAPDGRPVFVVAKSLGTLALPWAVQHGLPGAWLTPLLRDAAVVAAVQEAQQRTLLVGGTSDPHWIPPASVGSGVALLELSDADHGLQQPGDWRRSLLRQVEIFDRVRRLAEAVLQSTGRSAGSS